jgi:hypothetical protein
MTGGSHLSLEVLRRLARRELSPRQIAEVFSHLGECADCAMLSADELETELEALHAPIDDEGPWHPDASDITAFADGTAGEAEREIVSSHLEDCALCRQDVADLTSLRASRPRRRSWYVPAAVAASLAAVVFLAVQRSETPREVVRHSPAPVATHRPSPVPATTSTSAPAPPPSPRYANAEWDRLVRVAIESGRLPIARGLDVSPDTLRGSAGDASPKIAPANVVLDETRPRFSWPARADATYVVSIFEGDRRVRQSEPLTRTHWTPPQPLVRGRTYLWQVQVTRDRETEIIPAPPTPPATFHIVSRRDHEELTEARRLYPDDPMLHAVLAARAGLRDEALAALARTHAAIRVD